MQHLDGLRFLSRVEHPKKHWKFSAGDLAERAHWDEYMEAFEDALTATSTHGRSRSGSSPGPAAARGSPPSTARSRWGR